MNKSAANTRPKIGVSSCLLGVKSRYDGGHKQDAYISNVLSQFFTFAPICPELEAGMGKIREPVQLEGSIKSPCLVGTKSGVDWTDKMHRYSSRRLNKKDLAGISGCIFKSKSPSCGMARVKLYNPTGRTLAKSVGLFAAALMKKYPDLPIEEEGRLRDSKLRENFTVRVFAYDRLRQLFGGRFRHSEVVAFHAAHECLLLVHHPATYREIGRLVVQISDIRASGFRERYSQLFMRALSYHSTVKKNVKVLKHLMGSLKSYLVSDDKADILRVIDEYHRERVPLIVPLTLIRHYANKYQIAGIQNQVYLSPHPGELMLRNRV